METEEDRLEAALDRIARQAAARRGGAEAAAAPQGPAAIAARLDTLIAEVRAALGE